MRNEMQHAETFLMTLRYAAVQAQQQECLNSGCLYITVTSFT